MLIMYSAAKEPANSICEMNVRDICHEVALP